MKLLSAKLYSVALLRKHPDKVFLFGDNLKGYGKGGQAIIRDEINAIGIPTKKSPSMDKTAFFTDTEYTYNKKVIDEAFMKIPKNKTIVVPKDNLGTGRAQLTTKAPKTWLYLQEKLKELKKHRK
jgi:hypothetical protein